LKIREIITEAAERTGSSDTAVVGWGRGMGHRGHMMLASSVITHARDLGADAYFFVSRTVGPDDPITPEEKLDIYRRVFPQSQDIFRTATDTMPDLTRVLAHLNRDLGYRKAVVVVGADQKDKLSYVLNYNGRPNRAGDIPFDFENLQVIARQDTSDASREQEGPRATPMRNVLKDPAASDEEKFRVWRDAMSPELSDDEVRELMNKASSRMAEYHRAPAKKSAKPQTNESLRRGEWINWRVLFTDGTEATVPAPTDEASLARKIIQKKYPKKHIEEITSDFAIQGHGEY
jgi:hypothetical protein